MLLELKCNNCGSQLRPEDISPHLSAARCHHCNALFALPSSAGGKPIARPEVNLPRNMCMEEQMDGISISRRWMGAKAWFLLFFAIIWNGFMVVWNGIALSKGVWIMAAFGTLHTGIGLFLIYTVATMFLNSTTVRVSQGRIQTRNGPLPWPGNKTLDRHEVKQFYCTEKISHSKNGTSIIYKVEAVLEGNRRETLVHDIPDHDQALYIEQQLEKHLGIRDVPVEGEYGR